jgi:hypothetical protein
MLIDTIASLLSSVDRRAHARAFLQDADSILNEILLPVSFPWTHRIKPVIKSIPHDIDELFGIRSTTSDELDVTNGMEHGKFENSLSLPYSAAAQPRTTWAAVKRSRDPGVIEHSTIRPPTWAHLSSTVVPFRPHPEDFDDPEVPGEISLRAFEQVQEKRRQSDALPSTHLNTQLVSFRVGSTSTRSTILNTSGIGQGPSLALLSAALPPSVQDGVPRTGTVVDENLGSYDCGASSADATDVQLVTGRTRRIWSTERPKGYVSLLTGQKLENGSHKRPRDVVVCLRVDGVLLSTTDAAAAANREYDSDLVNEIVETPNFASVGIESSWPGAHQQCTLDPSVLVKSLQCHRFDPESPSRLQPFQKPFSLSLITKLKFPLPVLNIVPPQIDCMPCEDGCIFTTCTSRGRMYTSRPPSIVASSQSVPMVDKDPSVTAPVLAETVTSICSFLDITAMDSNICSVCWSQGVPATELGQATLLRCSGCGIPVHRSCCGRPPQGSDWRCDACVDFDERTHHAPSSKHDAAERRELYTRHRWSLSCSECRILGGTLTRTERSGGEKQGPFLHDVCRVWGPSQLHAGLFCSLCNENSSPVLQCMADNCQVMFHPICALVASNASAWKRQHGGTKRSTGKEAAETRFDRTASDDEFLCTQFRLSKAEIGTTATGEKVIAPVAFCGHHNPDRRADLYGLYPAGRYLANGVMRIPPLPGSADLVESDDNDAADSE